MEHHIVVENNSLAEQLRMISLVTGESVARGVYYDIKKLYTLNEISPSAYLDVLINLKPDFTILDYISGINSINDDDVIVGIDEILTVRFNRMLKYFARSKLSLESFINDFEELVEYLNDLKDDSPEYNSLVATFELFEQAISLTKEYAIVAKDELTAIANYDAKVITSDPPVHSIIMPVIKPVFYITGVTAHLSVADINTCDNEVLIANDTNPVLYDQLKEFFEKSETAGKKSWGVLIIGLPYHTNKHVEVYKGNDDCFRLIPLYVS